MTRELDAYGLLEDLTGKSHEDWWVTPDPECSEVYLVFCKTGKNLGVAIVYTKEEEFEVIDTEEEFNKAVEKFGPKDLPQGLRFDPDRFC